MKKLFLLCLLIAGQSFRLSGQTSRHVVLVIIDGARYSETLGDTLVRFVPRMHALAQQGVVLDSMMNDSITVTARAIPAIWSGSWSIPKDTTVNGYANQYATAPTVWEYFRKSRGVDSTQAMYIMKVLNSPWIQSFHPEYGPAYWPWYLLQGVTDVDVWVNAKAKLQSYHPTLSVIYLPDVDAAPARGWIPYVEAIATADSIVGKLWEFLQSDPVFKNTTTLLVTNDHGRHLDSVKNGFVSHGDGCWGCRHIMFLGVGAALQKGTHISARHAIPDITPTIGSLLQFPTPYATGKPMLELLTNVRTDGAHRIIPATTSLNQNYPNPFNPTTMINYQLAMKSLVILKVYDLLGREVATLVNKEEVAGSHSVQWDASRFSSGVYLCRMRTGGFVGTKKLILMK